MMKILIFLFFVSFFTVPKNAKSDTGSIILTGEDTAIGMSVGNLNSNFTLDAEEANEKTVVKKECPDYLIKQKRREIKRLIERLNTLKTRIQNGTISFYLKEKSTYAHEKRSLLKAVKENQNALDKTKSKGDKSYFSLPRGPGAGEWGHSKFNLEKDLQKSKTNKTYIYYNDQKHIAHLHKKIRQWHEAKEKYIAKMLAKISRLQNLLKVWEKKANEHIKKKEAEIQKLRIRLENCL